MASSPTSVLSSTDNTKSGLDLKNEGNAYFMKRKFYDALACYSKGIKIVAHDDDDLEATLYSNISSCYFEMGDYGKWCYSMRRFAVGFDVSWYTTY